MVTIKVKGLGTGTKYERTLDNGTYGGYISEGQTFEVNEEEAAELNKREYITILDAPAKVEAVVEKVVEKVKEAVLEEKPKTTKRKGKKSLFSKISGGR